MLLTALSCSQLSAFAPVNFFEPRDSLVRLPFIKGRSLHVGAYAEVGASANGYAHDSHNRNILGLYDMEQRSAHMLLNPISIDSGSSEFEKIAGTNVAAGMFDAGPAGGGRHFDPVTHQNRGASVFEGDFSGFGLTLHATKGLPWIKLLGDWNLAVYLPVASRRVRNIRIADQTQIPARGGRAIARAGAASLFNQNLRSNMMTLFGQDLSATDVNGVGDVSVFLNWHHGKVIGDDYFKKLCGFVRVGVSIPTGSESHTQKPFRMPLGNDGAWGLSFSSGVKAEIVENARVGIYFDGMALFDTTKLRRVKTSKYQSEFMLLNSARVRKKHGFTFNATPYLELNHFAGGFSAKLAYQYTQHNKDKYKLRDDAFVTKLTAHLNKVPTEAEVAAGAGGAAGDHGPGDAAIGTFRLGGPGAARIIAAGALPSLVEGGSPHSIVNSANSLKRWDAHNIVVQLTWDIAHDVKSAPGAPQLALFYKRPLSGRGMIDTNVFGGHLAMNF